MDETLPRVLLVDDDVRLRELLQRYLQSQGFEVRGVGDAAQMRQSLDRGHFDLIVLDLMLPGENGLEICRRLRGQGDATPIVMLTAKGDEIDRIVGLEIGADDYVPKPVNPRELLARIRSVLRRTRPAPGAPQPDGGEVVFERAELDGRHHSPWVMEAKVEGGTDGSHLVVRLHYGGGLWGPVLEHLLRDEIDAAGPRLRALVSA